MEDRHTSIPAIHKDFSSNLIHGWQMIIPRFLVFLAIWCPCDSEIAIFVHARMLGCSADHRGGAMPQIMYVGSKVQNAGLC